MSFFLQDNKKSFTQEQFCTWPRFKTEACGISEMAYCSLFRTIYQELFMNYDRIHPHVDTCPLQSLQSSSKIVKQEDNTIGHVTS